MQGSLARPVTGLARAAFAAALCCLLAAVWPSGRTAHAAPAGALSMTPGAAAIDVGNTLAVSVDLASGSDVHEVYLVVSFDPTVVSVSDADGATAGVQVLPGPFPGTDSDPATEGSVLDNDVDNSAGTVIYRYALAGSAESNGAGTIATIQFEAIAPGDAAITFITKTLRDAADVPVTPSSSAANLSVGGAAATPTATPTASPSRTATSQTTTSPTSTRTPTATRTATPATTAEPTITPIITILEDSNARTPAATDRPHNGVDPSQTDRANGLPDAGTEGPGVQWWRWSVFAAALMLGFAGWFFTFALHRNDREPVLMDRFDRNRRRQ